MLNKLSRLVLMVILGASLVTSGFLVYKRAIAEGAGRSVEIVVDLNDLKKLAAYEKKPLAPILDEIRKLGITGIGVFEETLPDASALGELYFAKGAGLKQLGLVKHKYNFRPERTYLYIPNEVIRKRVVSQLGLALGEREIKFVSKELIEVNEAEEEIRPLGLGISEAQKKFLVGKGFQIVPRLANDPHYHLGNIEKKIASFKGKRLIIFDGEEILGFPDALPALAEGLKNYGLNYGFLEIVKQAGDQRLKRLMGENVLRTQSVPKDELKKIEKAEALDRFARAVRERSVKVIYLRPFLPPQIDAYPIAYNLKYFGELCRRLKGEGVELGSAGTIPPVMVEQWQVIILGLGVLIGLALLINLVFSFPLWTMLLAVIVGGGGLVGILMIGKTLVLQKSLALLAALVFPSKAVASVFLRSRSEKPFSFLKAAVVIQNILLETAVGILLMIGLLTDYRFISGVEAFPAVKVALTLPVLIVAAVLYFKMLGGGGLERVKETLNTKVTLLQAAAGLFVLAGLGLLIARSGNFVLPVPALEKYFRNWLEVLLMVRPRTKEFLIGYPALVAAAWLFARADRRWVWLVAALGVVAPVSVFNTFSHIHTPLMISLIRSLNGLLLGLIAGWLIYRLLERYFKQ